MIKINHKPISSQAKGSAKSTLEGSETRIVTSTTNNRSHERPAPRSRGDDIVRYLREILRAGINCLRNICEEGLIAGAFQVDQYGGTPTHCFMHPVNYRDLVNALGAKCNYERVQSQHAGVKAPIGFRAVMLDGPKGPVACVSDNACQLGIAWMLDLSTWVLASLGSAPKLLMRDGNKILRQAAADGYEVRCGYYAQIGCKAPGYNCAITL